MVLDTKEKKPDALFTHTIIKIIIYEKTHSEPLLAHLLHPVPKQYGHVANTLTPELDFRIAKL